MLFNIDFKVDLPKADVLNTLRTNRENHIALVTEARSGYLRAARQKLEKWLTVIDEGKVERMRWDLPVPTDHTSVYDTTIEMIEKHTGDTISLQAREFRMLMHDDWEWRGEFVGSSSSYSPSIERWNATKE